MFFWGQQTPTLAVLLQAFDPFALSVSRYLVAIPALVLIVYLRNRRLEIPPPDLWLKLVVLGTFGIGGLTTFMTLGIRFSDPVTAIMIQATGPLMSAAFAVLVFGERWPAGSGIAFAITVPGAVLVLMPAGRISLDLEFQGGEIFLFCATFCWAWYSLQCQRWIKTMGPARITLWTLVASYPSLILLWLVTGAIDLIPDPSAPVTPGLLVLMAYVTITATAMGVILWHGGVTRLGLAGTALYLNLAPVFAVLVAMVYGLYPTTNQVLGGLLVIAGVAQIHVRTWVRAKRERAKDRDGHPAP